MKLELRHYQRATVDAMLRDLDEEGSALGVLATGTGKTAVIAALAEAMRELTGKPVLALAQRKELLEQIAGAAQRWTSLSTGLEIAEQRVARLPMPDLVAASVGSMKGARLTSFDPSTFGAVLVDEAHHAVAPGHRTVLDWFKAPRAGFTATADRLDGKALGLVFKRLSYTYDVRTAITEGFLAPVRQQVVNVDGLDFSAVRKTAGEFNEKDLEKILAEDGALHGMAVPTLELAKGRPGIVFGVTVAHAEALARVMCSAKAGCAAVVHGEMKDSERAAVLRSYSEGRMQFLVNVALLTEGVDLPRTTVVSMARPTLSRALYTQMIGRGTRLFPEKTHCLVIDFAGNAGRHKLVTAFDVLGDTDDPDARKRAMHLMAADPTLTLMVALDRARAQLVEERNAEVRRRADEKRARAELIEKAQREAEERTKKAAEEQLALFRREHEAAQRPYVPPARVAYTVQTVDPFADVDDLLGVKVTHDAEKAREEPPTEAQLGVLERAGYATKNITKRDASTIISAIVARREQGLCTVKQARLLARHGLRTDLSIEDASHCLDAIAKNNWRVPLTLDAKFRVEKRPALASIPGGRAA